MGETWMLLDNDSHRVLYFGSERRLRGYAREHGMRIVRSPMTYRGFYTLAGGYVPGNGGD